MQAVFPGQPQADLHALSFGYHEGQLVVVYTSGCTLVICNGHSSILQTVTEESAGPQGFRAVDYHQQTGHIAAISRDRVYVYVLHEEIKGTLRWQKELDFPVERTRGSINTLSWGADGELLIATTEALLLYNTRLPQSTPPSSPAGLAYRRAATSPVWTRSTASPVQIATLSPSAFLIATLSQYDCLIKIWRRLSSESAQFDFAYLRHPDTVTSVAWRRHGEADHTVEGEDEHISGGVHGGDDDVLFTVCADGVFRAWKSDHAHGVDILTLYAQINLVGGLQPRSPLPDGDAGARWACVLDSVTVQRLAKQEDGSRSLKGQTLHVREHFDEVVARNPDVLLIADGRGHMSAWGLESVGCKRRPSTPHKQSSPMHISYREGVDLGFGLDVAAANDYALMRAVCVPSAPGQLAILTHHFDGRISWTQTGLQDLLSPAESIPSQRLADWTGHCSPIKKVIRTASGRALISRTEDNVGIVWKQSSGGDLARRSTVSLKEHIHRAVLLREGDFLVCLHHDKIALWDTRRGSAKHVKSLDLSTTSKPLCLLVLPRVAPGSQLVHLATMCSDGSGLAWQLSLPHLQSTEMINGVKETADDKIMMQQFATFEIEGANDMVYVLPVDPAGKAPVASDFLDAFSHDVAMSYTSTGTLRTYTAGVNQEAASVTFLTTATLETGVQHPALGSATSIRRAALVDSTRTTLSIWDTRGARLDHKEDFHGQIRDLDWAATPSGQSVLAVGFARSVHMYAQLRYDYVSDVPAWACVKVVKIPDYNPSMIGDSVWLSHGQLAIGAGNQLHLVARNIDLTDTATADLAGAIPHRKTAELFDFVERLNSTLPVFHPQFITQCILAGKVQIVKQILSRFLEMLKFYTDGDDLDPLLGFDVDDFVTHDQSMPTVSQRVTIDKATAEVLNDLLARKSVPQLTSAEQLSLATIIECVATLDQHSRSLDANGSRFLLFWRLVNLRAHQGRSSDQTALTWREACFAYHSGSQDILRGLVTAHAPSQQLTWPLAKQSKIFTWLTDRTAILEMFEQLARSAYATSDPRDPVDCSLYYLALRKKPILVGLWRMATWHREQAATMKVLRNDFGEARWRTAAKKNAFALLGKRRFHYAAAFFLLAEDLKSALNVITNQLDDVELAIAVGRVYGGDNCDEVQDLVRDQILPAAVQRGDRWMANWLFWFLGDRGRAVRALISSLDKVAVSPSAAEVSSTSQHSDGGRRHKEQEDLSLRAKSFLNEDPALVVLYEQLRARSLQTLLRGALLVSGTEEWTFLSRTAGLLARMGCDILALDLVRNWEFLLPAAAAPPSPSRARIAKTTGSRADDSAIVDDGDDEGAESVGALMSASPLDPRKLLRRRSSLVVDDLGSGGAAGDGTDGVAGLHGRPTRPHRSILDSFETEPSRSSTAATKPPRSMLDDFGIGAEVSQPTQPVKQPRSLLDDFGFGAQGRPQPQASTAKVRSLLDDFGSGAEPSNGEKQGATPAAAPRSMLDDFQGGVTTEGGHVETAGLVGQEKQGEDAQLQEKRKPTEFKEPSAASILDSFNF